jgi:hypothetical protein
VVCWGKPWKISWYQCPCQDSTQTPEYKVEMLSLDLTCSVQFIECDNTSELPTTLNLEWRSHFTVFLTLWGDMLHVPWCVPNLYSLTRYLWMDLWFLLPFVCFSYHHQTRN